MERLCHAMDWCLWAELKLVSRMELRIGGGVTDCVCARGGGKGLGGGGAEGGRVCHDGLVHRQRCAQGKGEGWGRRRLWCACASLGGFDAAGGAVLGRYVTAELWGLCPES